jgi:hypothetical protein
MVPDPHDDTVMLSDKELLDSIEKLLRAPGFVDLCLGYDPASETFYAGSEIAGGLRDVLRRVLRENRPNGLSLRDLIGHSCSSSRSRSVGPETSDKSQSGDNYASHLL